MGFLCYKIYHLKSAVTGTRQALGFDEQQPLSHPTSRAFTWADQEILGAWYLPSSPTKTQLDCKSFGAELLRPTFFFLKDMLYLNKLPEELIKIN